MKMFSQANFTEAGKIAVDKALSKSYLGIGNVITYFDKFHSIGDSITTNKNKLLFPYKDYVSWGFSNFSTCDLAEKNFVPIFIKYKGKPCVIFCGMVYKKVLNTRIFENPSDRASNIWAKIGLDAFTRLSKNQGKQKPFYTGVHIVYETSDFTKEYDFEEAEDVLFIAPTNSIKELGNMNLSESAFYKLVNVFIRPRKTLEVRLIK